MNLALVFVLSVIAQGPAYKCKDAAGAISFSDRPCPSGADLVKKTALPSDGGRGSASSVTGDDPRWCDEGVAPADLVNACLDAWRPSLRDPRGAYAEGGRLTRNQKNGDLDVFVNGYAKNGFGGTNALEMQCKRTPENALETSGTESWIKLYLAFSQLNVKPSPHVVEQCSSGQ
ncbi:DUF4124 domain-containing protein [Tahibacter soli]|uniref:DUF4124 domain-containing protein n=1 Tax=Tahibacter soli TaxID=2983605 RepID=A0A9X3YHH9_9GAMM|nr:DUF4124 domain-containing protein [Tahibacter soli]MDC8011687.1 DUF4124 domain-containing protein [Tahibacter soli]